MRNKRIIFFIILLMASVSYYLINALQNNNVLPDTSKQWALNNDGKMSDMNIDNKACSLTREQLKKGVDINISKFWNIVDKNNLGDEVVVAMIDSGVDFNNKQLEAHKWENKNEINNNQKDDDGNGYIDDIDGWDFVNNSINDDKVDNIGHGTACAGIICADSYKGITGVVNSHNIKIMSLKTFKYDKEANNEQNVTRIIKAIRYAEQNGAQICNMSFGLNKFNQDLYNCMKKSNMLFICSAGNNNGFARLNIDEFKYYPISFDLDNIIAVANIGFDGQLYKTSNYGKESVDVVAPGTNIYVMKGGNNYGYETGTSFSVAYVSGIAAALASTQKSITNDEIKRAICETVTKYDALKEICRFGGCVNAEAAINSILGGE